MEPFTMSTCRPVSAQEEFVSASSRVSWAVMAVALFPCWAAAQANVVDRTDNDASGVAQRQVAAVQSPAPNVSVDIPPLPAPQLEVDPIPGEVGGQAVRADVDVQTTDVGPTEASTTAGIQPRAAHLTRRQLADRASQSGGDPHAGLGTDVALMIVGGAAIIVGAIVGGGAGTAIIVVGAAIGITGLVLLLM
jgi:hypothetical protein